MPRLPPRQTPRMTRQIQDAAYVRGMDPGVKAEFIPHFNRARVFAAFTRNPGLQEYIQYLPAAHHAPVPNDGMLFLLRISRAHKLNKFERDMYEFYHDGEEFEQRRKAKGHQVFRRHITRTGHLPLHRDQLTRTIGSFNGGRRMRKTRKR